MTLFNQKYVYSVDKEEGGIQINIDPIQIPRFNVGVLNLGDVRTPSKPIDVLAVLFDLEGFTNFIRQVDPQLTVPIFISDFLNWLFQKIKDALVKNATAGTLWAEFPFYSKFMGDSVLFLWRIDLDSIVSIDLELPSDAVQSNIQEFICNIIASQLEVCRDCSNFLDITKTQHVNPPSLLRCGIARGTVIPIGGGADFVGPCINIAARLQKFNGLSFTYSARGIDKSAFHEQFRKDFITKRASVRGIGDNELIYVLTGEYEALPSDLKARFNDP